MTRVSGACPAEFFVKAVLDPDGLLLYWRQAAKLRALISVRETRELYYERVCNRMHLLHAAWMLK